MSDYIIKNPLAINIFWDSANENMYQLGNLIYSFFLRDVENPLDRYLDIPVYIYLSPPELTELQLEDTIHSANVFLVDDYMTLSFEWEAFTNDLAEKISTLAPSKHRIYPVAVAKSALNFTANLADTNFLRLYEESEERKEHFLLITLAHDISRLIYKQPRVSEVSSSNINPCIKLFISHAKQKGLDLAKKLWKHIESFSGLNSFFDAKDISNGFSFSKQIREEIEKTNSMLITIQTDDFSSRQWCRKEVLWAKKNERPIIVVNQYEKGELRTFPYIGNVPHIRYTLKCEEAENEQTLLDYIVLEAIREALKIQYNLLKIETLNQVFNQKVNRILPYPPELVVLSNLNKLKKEVVLYPDPPLGQEELALLEEFRPNLKFITPTLIPLLVEKGSKLEHLNTLKVAISLSEIKGTLMETIQNRAIEDLMVEVTRYLLVSGVQLIYSGKTNYESDEMGFNFFQLLIDLVETYQKTFDESIKVKTVINYSFYPLYDLLPIAKKAELKKLVDFIPVPPPKYLEVGQDAAKEIVKLDSFDKKYVWAKSCSKMRQKMAKEADAVIVLGGKWLGFTGRIPGILEETLCAFDEGKPIYLIGAFGGVAQGIADALKGKQPKKLRMSFFEKEYPDYAHFLRKFNSAEWTEEVEKVDYQEIVKRLNKQGVAHEDYGLNNGLSRFENERLFHSKNDIEILSLILKGLKTIQLNEKS